MIELNDLNKVTNHNYVCKCGCNLEFIGYSPGIDIYAGIDTNPKWIITHDGMVEYKWRDYISLDDFTLWKDFREYIILSYNEIIYRNVVYPEDAPWIHLYNREVDNHIPLNAKLSYEYIF